MKQSKKFEILFMTPLSQPSWSSQTKLFIDFGLLRVREYSGLNLFGFKNDKNLISYLKNYWGSLRPYEWGVLGGLLIWVGKNFKNFEFFLVKNDTADESEYQWWDYLLSNQKTIYFSFFHFYKWIGTKILFLNLHQAFEYSSKST